MNLRYPLRNYHYLIDCTAMTPEGARKVYDQLHASYDFVDIVLQQPRTYALLVTNGEPELSTVFSPPVGCQVTPLQPRYSPWKPKPQYPVPAECWGFHFFVVPPG